MKHQFFATTVAALWFLLSACSSAQAEDAAEQFNTLCAPCHGKDGKARTPIARKLGVKDLSQSRLPDEEIIKQILEGKRVKDGKLQVMPAFKERLSPEQVKALLPVVKKFRQ